MIVGPLAHILSLRVSSYLTPQTWRLLWLETRGMHPQTRCSHLRLRTCLCPIRVDSRAIRTSGFRSPSERRRIFERTSGTIASPSGSAASPPRVDGSPWFRMHTKAREIPILQMYRFPHVRFRHPRDPVVHHARLLHAFRWRKKRNVTGSTFPREETPSSPPSWFGLRLINKERRGWRRIERNGSRRDAWKRF